MPTGPGLNSCIAEWIAEFLDKADFPHFVSYSSGRQESIPLLVCQPDAAGPLSIEVFQRRCAYTIKQATNAGFTMAKIVFRLLSCILTFSLAIATAPAQTAWVGPLDQSDFPSVHLPIILLDAQNQLVTDPSAADFGVRENSFDRPIESLICSPLPPQQLSSVLMIDVSESMAVQYLDIARDAARTWLNMLDFETSECALASFNDRNAVNVDFTDTRSDIENALNQLEARGNTSFDAALLDPKAAALDIASTGRYQPIVIILTDGDSFGSESAILDKLDGSGIRVYSILLGIEIPALLQTVADASGGLAFANINTPAAARAAFARIFVHASGGEPCRLTWTAADDCSTARDVEVLYRDILVAETDYEVGLDIFPSVSWTNVYQDLGEVEPATSRSFNLTMRAGDLPVNIEGLRISNPAVTVANYNGAPPPFELNAGEERTINCEYLAPDSLQRYVEIEIESDACRAARSTVLAGFRGARRIGAGLTLRHPNGGEVFTVGEDVEVRWEGSAAFNRCRVELSSDNGDSWNVVGETEAVNTLTWQAAEPVGNQWLARVSALNSDGGDGSWVWGSQRSGAAAIRDLAIDDIGRVFVIGDFAAQMDLGDGFLLQSEGLRDVFLAEFSPAGHVVNALSFGGVGDDYAAAIELDGNNGAVFLAAFNGTALLQDELYTSNGNSDFILGRIAPGLTVSDVFTLGSPAQDVPGDLALASNGDIVVVGSIGADIGLFNRDISIKGAFAAAMIKLSRDYQPLNLNVVDGDALNITPIDRFTCVAIDARDRVYAAGAISRGATFKGAELTHSGVSGDMLIALYREDGAEHLAFTLNSSADVFATDILADVDNQFVVCGEVGSLDLTGAGAPLRAGGIRNVFIGMFQRDGRVNWADVYGEVSTVLSPRMEHAAEQDQIVLGTTYSRRIQFGLFNLIDGGGDVDGVFGDMALVRFDYDGDVQQAESFGSLTIDQLTAMTLRSDNLLALGGTFQAPLTLSDTTLTPAGRQDMFVWNHFGSNGIVSDQSNRTWTVTDHSFETVDIDFGLCAVNTACERLFDSVLVNTGGISVAVDAFQFGAGDIDDFQLVAPSMPVSIEGDSDAGLELRFSPRRVGPHQVELNFVAAGGRTLRTVVVRGEGYIPDIALESTLIDFGEVVVGTEKVLTEVVLRNVGVENETIDRIALGGPDLLQFNFKPIDLPVTLAPAETLKLELSFTPQKTGRFSSSLVIESDSEELTTEVSLFGTGVQQNIRVFVDDAAAAVGEDVDIVVKAEHSLDLADVEFIALEVELDLNAFLLYPRDPGLRSTFNGGRYLIPLMLQVPATPGEHELARLGFTALLGPESESLLLLSLPNPDHIPQDVQTDDGLFRLQEICEAGNALRLFNNGGGFGLANVNVESPAASMTFEANFPGRDHATISLYSALGDLTAVYYDADMQPGAWEFTADISTVTSGVYYLVLRSGALVSTAPLVIGR